MPWADSADLDIFLAGSWRSMIRAPRPAGGDGGLGHDEGRPVAGVEPLGQVPGQLEVLALVVADRHPVGVVEEDVGGHQRRVGEQADPGRLLAAFGRLVLELGHPPQLAHAGRALEQPGQLGVLGDVALHEERGHLGVEPDGQQHGGRGQGGPAQLVGIAGARSGRGGRRRSRSCRPCAGPRPTTATPRGSCRGGCRRSAGCRRGPWSRGHAKRTGVRARANIRGIAGPSEPSARSARVPLSSDVCPTR